MNYEKSVLCLHNILMFLAGILVLSGVLGKYSIVVLAGISLITRPLIIFALLINGRLKKKAGET